MLASGLLLAADLTFHLGIGLGLAHVPAQDFPIDNPAASQPNGLAVSVEGQIEYGAVFGGATVLLAGPGTADVASASLRAGVFLTSGPIAPYIAAGAAWLHEGLYDGDQPPNTLFADGVALVAEAGVTAPRDWAHGRLNLYLQLQMPAFDAPPDPGHQPPKPKTLYLLGVRLLF